MDFNVYQLFGEVDKKGWTINSFVDWVLRPDTVEIVRVQTPGFRAKRFIDHLTHKIQGIYLKKDSISVVQNETLISFSWKSWHEDIKQRLKRVSENYNIIDNMDIEDIDKSVLYQRIYYILKDFLLVFAKCFAAIREEKISFMSRTTYLDSWEFITAAILAYQRDNNLNFKSYRFIWHIRNNNTAIKRKAFSPNEDDIKTALKNLEEIIVEFSRELENILVGYAQETMVKEKAEPEFHESLRLYVDKLAQKMGYVEDLENYRVFRVDGQEYVKLDLFKSPTNTAELDIVRRKQQIERKDGKTRYQYLIAEIKRERKPADKKDALLFLKKCEDLIKILENETAYLPQILKPEYTLWFVSYSGFTNEAYLIFRGAKRPPRTSYHLMSIKELNEKLSEYGLKKYST